MLFYPNPNKKKNHLYLPLLSIIIPFLYVVIINGTGIEPKWTAILLALPVFLLFVFNTELIILISVVVFFLDGGFSVFKIAVLTSVPMALSYVLTYKNSARKDFEDPLFLPFAIYCVSIIPSFFNSLDIVKTLIYTFNLVSMGIVGYCVGRYLDSYKSIKKIAIVFTAMVALNGVHVIYEAILTGERVFGFMGVVFVDYVCVAIIIVLVNMLYKRKGGLTGRFAAIIMLLTALIATQTRNSAFALFGTFCLILVFLLKKATDFSIDRKKTLLLLSFGIVVFLGGITLAITMTPQVLGRFAELFVKEQISISAAKDFGQNTLITRLLIWYSSIVAYMQHPIIGIGAFSFVFESGYYNTLPNTLYKLFVEGMSPHVTYLAVLTETGLFGMFGFLILIIACAKTSLRAVDMSSTRQQKYYSLAILSVQLYIILSMFLTDAWLWGQCGMLWALLMGVCVGNYNMIKQCTISHEK